MNDPTVIGIPIAFAVVGCLLLWFIIGGRGHWSIKIVMVAAVSLASFLVWSSASHLVGWPTTQRLPEKFELHWPLVKEPGKTTDGCVRLWVTEITSEEVHTSWNDLFAIARSTDAPRAYHMPYSRQLHEQAMGAQQQIAAGRRVMGTRKGVESLLEGKAGKLGDGDGDGKGGKGGGEGEGDGKGEGEGQAAGSTAKNDAPVFYPLPPPVAPKKD